MRTRIFVLSLVMIAMISACSRGLVTFGETESVDREAIKVSAEGVTASEPAVVQDAEGAIFVVV